MTTEVPLGATSYSRFQNKKILKGNKAEVCVCGKTNYGWSEETKCEECGKVCYYTPDNLDLKKKNIKKICIECALKNKKDMPKEVIEILEKIK